MSTVVIYKIKEKKGLEYSLVVGPRLDIFTHSKEKELSENKIKIEAVLSVTDRLVLYNNQFPNAWFPWIEGKYPTEEVIFGSLMTLRNWVVHRNFKTIYIHCDAGTHRSPTITGMYLIAFKDYFESMQKVLPSRTHPDRHSDALFYAETYLNPQGYSDPQPSQMGLYYQKLLPNIVKNFEEFKIYPDSRGTAYSEEVPDWFPTGDFLENSLPEDWPKISFWKSKGVW